MQGEKRKETPTQAEETSLWESVRVAGTQLGEKIESLINEGDVRRVVIKHDEHTIAEFPLTVGVVGVAIAPVVAAVGAMAVLATECTVEIERIAPHGKSAPAAESAPIQTDETIEPAEPAVPDAAAPSG